ncbi:uncharacterized protein EV420DRAFT_1743917 [Desarmillaria tabescens]|uniref:Uncharacterized protein n=1 Tax=Armillaria tabescens TaxID=1929756 RepID=A0AA39NIC1_ARMTA|nr:uncharacterized protein EV420DRAFT_1743917 [Desarmillaria tabescens]KAK0466069.1 hypothetical protein EV420DRAFT_1743917 [Desarmillaria tabescens]
MMLPQFGEYFTFRLDPVASLKSLNDDEVNEACKALGSGKTYVASVINLLSFPVPGTEYLSVALTLVSQGLPEGLPESDIMPEMSVAILPNTSNPLSRPPLEPSTPLPWSDCYHPTQSMTTCRIKNDIILGKPWPTPKCRIDGHARNLLGGTYYYEDAERREVLRKAREQPPTSSQPEEHEAFSVISPLPESQPDTHSDYEPSLKDPEDEDDTPAFDMQSQCSESPSMTSEVSELQEPGHRRRFSFKSFFRRLFRKILPCVPCLRGNFCDDDSSSMSPSFDPYAVIAGLFGPPPEDTMPVIVVSKDLKSVQEISNPWDFFRELDTLKKIEEQYHERVKAKTQAAIESARQKDEQLHARLQEKMPRSGSVTGDTSKASASSVSRDATPGADA